MTNMTKTVMIMAGGTGGHIFPGIAIAEALRLRGWQIAWLGHPEGMEAKIIAERAYIFCPLDFTALRGKGIWRKLLLPINLGRALWQAFGLLRKTSPDVVVGMGGYVTFPGGLMAALQQRALLIHEQNSVAGLANRILAKMANVVACGFPGAIAQAKWLGNPVRAEFFTTAIPAQRFAGRTGVLRLFVVGGSLGAQVLNQVIPEALAILEPEIRPQVVHQSGSKGLAEAERCYEQHQVTGDLRSFIDNVHEEMARADLVICRAGALTIAELAAVGAASVLIPFPFAVDDHQTGNARFLSDNDAAVLMPQAGFNARSLADLLRSMSRDKLLMMAENARVLGRPSAVADFVDLCEAQLDNA